MKKFRTVAMILACAFIFMTAFGVTKAVTASAAESEASQEAEEEGSATGSKAIAAGIVVGLAAAAGAIGMGLAVAKSNESIARQPEMAGKINSTMMLGMVFIETVVIYALIVAILIIFVL